MYPACILYRRQCCYCTKSSDCTKPRTRLVIVMLHFSLLMIYMLEKKKWKQLAISISMRMHVHLSDLSPFINLRCAEWLKSSFNIVYIISIKNLTTRISLIIINFISKCHARFRNVLLLSRFRCDGNGCVEDISSHKRCIALDSFVT